MTNSESAIAAVRDGSSLAWAFYRPEEVIDGQGVVEVRLNASPKAVANFTPPLGWEIDRIQWGDTLFLRREQWLERNAVEEMLVEMLQFAASQDLQFHSWLHGADLDD